MFVCNLYSCLYACVWIAICGKSLVMNSRIYKKSCERRIKNSKSIRYKQKVIRTKAETEEDRKKLKAELEDQIVNDKSIKLNFIDRCVLFKYCMHLLMNY